MFSSSYFFFKDFMEKIKWNSHLGNSTSIQKTNLFFWLNNLKINYKSHKGIFILKKCALASNYDSQSSLFIPVFHSLIKLTFTYEMAFYGTKNLRKSFESFVTFLKVQQSKSKARKHSTVDLRHNKPWRLYFCVLYYCTIARQLSQLATWLQIVVVSLLSFHSLFLSLHLCFGRNRGRTVAILVLVFAALFDLAASHTTWRSR
jgi:hypothetical protein